MDIRNQLDRDQLDEIQIHPEHRLVRQLWASRAFLLSNGLANADADSLARSLGRSAVELERLIVSRLSVGILAFYLEWQERTWVD